ncbi:MFS transporter [Dietzia cercidiphylli]|nr:MFS transporter [Dietzia cercidiphylli]MCT1516261.1 MFS transporter [Dietzia cercidiphylli]
MTTPKSASVQAGEDGEFSHRQILVILAGLMSAMFLASLDQTIVSTAIRTIADDLQGLDAQAWVTTAYLMTSTISTPLYGKLSDIYGRKPFFVIGIVIFVFGSLLCTLADSMYTLALYRGIQGLGAGALMSLSLAIIGDIIPPRDRAKYQGYMLAVFASSSVIGPVVGGFFAGVETIFGIDGWRWIFLINVPIGAIALTLVMITLNVKNVRVDHRVDWAGAATIVVGLVPLLLVAEQGNS